MAEPLVVPGVVRFQVLGHIGQRPWCHTHDVDFGVAAPVGGGVMKTLAEKIMDVYAGQLPSICVNSWNISGCRWIDLNSALGETGNINDTPTGTFPFPGTLATDPAPANVAILARKATQGARNHRNGRNYYCGFPESATTGNTLGSTALASWSTAVATIASVLTGSTSGIGHIYVVAGRDKDGHVHKSVVATYSPDNTLATMRRRLRP